MTATISDVVQAEGIEEHRRAALVQREWARTGEHGWSERPRLHSLVGWHVFPGMVMPERFSNRIAELGLGDVRVVGQAQPTSEHRWASWSILVESIATGERAVFTTYSYDSHDCHVWAPSFMTSIDAFHAQYSGALSYADERFEL